MVFFAKLSNANYRFMQNSPEFRSQHFQDKIGKFGTNNDLISGCIHKSGRGLGERGTAAVSSLANADPYISHHLFYLSMFLLQVPSAYRSASPYRAAEPHCQWTLILKNILWFTFNTVGILFYINDMMRYLFRRHYPFSEASHGNFKALIRWIC